MLAGCTSNSLTSQAGEDNGDGETGETVVNNVYNNYYNNTTNVVHNHYYNNTTEEYTTNEYTTNEYNISNEYNTSAPPPQIIMSKGGNLANANNNLTIDAGQMVEVMEALAGSTLNGTHTDTAQSPYVRGHASCETFSIALDMIGNTHTYGDMASDWLPTDGGICTYTFWASTGNSNNNVFVMYRIHDLAA